MAVETWGDFALYLFLFVLSGASLFVVGVVAYRLTLHPLAKYPGPLLGRFTDSYSVYQAWTGERHVNFYKLHQKYGKVVRYGPDKISIDSNVALSDIYGYKANVRKAQFYAAFPATKGSWSTHSVIDKALHARKRRVLSQGFSDAALKGLQPHILSVIRTFTEAIGDFRSRDAFGGKKEQTWSTPKDMAKWSNYMSYDVLGDVCYGESFDTLERPDNRFAIKLVEDSTHFHYLCAQMPRLKELGLDRLFFRDLRANRVRFMQYSRARLQKRMQLGTDTDRRDFFYFLLKAKDPETGQGFSREELWGESNVLLIAGSDTTSTAFSSTFHYLLHNPQHLSKLTAQIRSKFTSLESIVSGPTLNECRFLRACIDESMRLVPPVPGLLPREVLDGGADIDGMHFPTGTSVGVPTFALHHNPAYHPDPFKYDPMRWIEGGEHNEKEDRTRRTREEVELAQSAFAPFSVGPRGCIGKGVAYMELSLALARTLWLYDLRLVDGHKGTNKKNDYPVQDIFVAAKAGPIVQFRRREGVDG